MDIKLDKKNVTGPIREYVYQTLKTYILNLKLEPGRAISESEISEWLEVSRTPVREAFLKLAQEELLVVYPQKGTFVSLIDLDLLEEGRFLREHMERAVVRLACNVMNRDTLLQLETNLKLQGISVEMKDYVRLYELDEEFHRLIFRGCNKERIWNSIQQLNADFNRIRILRLSVNMDWDRIIIHHTHILEAIKGKNEERAERIMTEHLHLVIDDANELSQKYAEYFKKK
ncbi:GntR family transcriptional regulator [Ammoniphilus sp. YIM 78166]|uniref:GntR family transcriptional regulator n=1 Tax=Ammoniphilus sp. YIM 78166 TaxID=1644106 RepID=UPI00106F658D|nr:GntR family transcriptional regulator [Ammoniphilus sp. YIM 78166]